MASQDFDDIAASGLLRDVEDIVVATYISTRPNATRPAAYHWLHYEDPDPVNRLADGVRRLRQEGATVDAEAVDKACAKASKLGF